MKGRSRAALPLLFGMITFGNVARNPRFETFHAVDIVGLVVCGICVGASLPILMGRLKSRDE